MILAAGLAAAAACDTEPTEPATEHTATLASFAMAPLVVERGGAGFRVYARVSGSSAPSLEAIEVTVQSAFLAAPPYPGRPVQRLLRDGVPVEAIRLADDGMNGDSTAGDGVFTSAELVPEDESPGPLATSFPLHFLGIDWEYADTTVAEVWEGQARIRGAVWDIDPALIPIPEVTDLDGARRTDHVISMVVDPFDTDVPPTEYRPGHGLTLEYYTLFNYDPDFLLFYEPAIRAVGDAGGYYTNVLQEVTGMGLETMDRAAEFASPGALQGFVIMAGGPSPGQHLLLTHELGHRWFAYPTELGIARNDGHWTAELDRDRTGFIHGRFNDLELYLMGLIPSDSVQPAVIGTNGATIQDLIDQYGPRTPAWPEAQTEFTLATVVALDRLLTPREFALFEFVASEYGAATTHPARTDTIAATFHEATGGRATLVTRIPDGAAR